MSTATPDANAGTRVITVVGPTAVGKSDLAEQLAQILGGEIVSADSMQVYRGMDVGTAKPPAEAHAVPYHCLDLVDPGAPFSAAIYQDAARAAIADIARRGRVPIVCGGTGLYIRAALDDWEFPGGEISDPRRAELEAEAATLGPEAMHAKLAAIDPPSAEVIHPSNVRRTVRALEMAEQGCSYAEQAGRFSQRRSVYDATYLGLTMEREALYARIDARVDRMLAHGLRAEVERLLAAGFRDTLTAAQAIGYKELVRVIEDDTLLETAVEDIKRTTRRYAKRQLTWFRGDTRIRWIDATGATVSDITRAALHLLESDEPRTERPAPGSWRLTTE